MIATAKAVSLIVLGATLISSCGEMRGYNKGDQMYNAVVQKEKAYKDMSLEEIKASPMFEVTEEKVNYFIKKIKDAPVEKLDGVSSEISDFFTKLRKDDRYVFYTFQLYEGILQDDILNRKPGRKVSE